MQSVLSCRRVAFKRQPSELLSGVKRRRLVRVSRLPPRTPAFRRGDAYDAGISTGVAPLSHATLGAAAVFCRSVGEDACRGRCPQAEDVDHEASAAPARLQLRNSHQLGCADYRSLLRLRDYFSRWRP